MINFIKKATKITFVVAKIYLIYNTLVLAWMGFCQIIKHNRLNKDNPEYVNGNLWKRVNIIDSAALDECGEEFAGFIKETKTTK